MSLTSHQRELARHALGLPNQKKQSYRNRFVAGKGHADYAYWQQMVDFGFAGVCSGNGLFGDSDLFYLTPAGAQAVLEPREKLCPEDFPSLITRPMLFSAPMIRALNDGRKTQTRRVMNNTKYGVGNRLWVRETWQKSGIGWNNDIKAGRLHYRADNDHGWQDYWGKWKPSIHMPRWISRMTLTVTKVRVQRLQDISEEDAIAEGCGQYSSSTPLYEAFDPDRKGSYREGFRELWNNLNADRGHGWNKNPWVTALTFTVDQRNIDEVEPND